MPPHPTTLTGVVVSAGKMMKAVTVRTAHQTYNSFLRKNFRTFRQHLVSDPTSALRTGDIVRIASGWRTSRHIRHVVTALLAPYGVPVEERPRVLSEGERLEMRRGKRERKLGRRGERERARMRGGGGEEGIGVGEKALRNEGEGEGVGAEEVGRRSEGVKLAGVRKVEEGV